MTNNDKFISVQKFAKKLGFSHCGVSDIKTLDDETNKLKQWIQCGYNAEMSYLQNNIEVRKTPSLLLPEAKSIIVVLKNYYNKIQSPCYPFKISRYAYGIDYHLWMKKKLNQLADFLNLSFPGNKNVFFSDAGPIMEKVWAKNAGLGWIGKNTLLINPLSGSFCFIGIIITTIDFSESVKPVVENACGPCTKCIDACPTKALKFPGILDARKCISYLTIEKKGEFTDNESESLNGWVFGCDICQEVCPYNKSIELHNDPDFEILNILFDLKNNIDIMSNSQFNKNFSISAIKRCSLKSLKRNFKSNRLFYNIKR